MKTNKYKQKSFLIPILFLVFISIISITLISAYTTINMFKIHMHEHIENTKKEYTKQHKNRVYKEVNFVNESIKYQINEIENKLKKSLEEKVKIALAVANYTYNTYKNELNKEEIKVKIAKALEVIKFNDNRNYYFMYDNKTKIIFGHYLKKFIGRDMTDFRDIKGRSLMELDSAILSKNKIGFSEIHFNKPDNENEEFPKITCITKFEPLDLVLGLGEYLDVIENQTKEYVLKRFSNSQYNKNDNYLVILDIHNTKGGDDFATVLLNSNSPHLVGKKVSDQDKDVKGNKFRNDFLNLVMKEGEGYSKYWYKKPSTQTPAMKISYFLFQKDWNWIIASGFYYEDLEKQIAIMKESIVSHTNETIHKTLVWVALFSLLAIVIAALVSFRIDNTIKKYTNAIIDYEDNKRKQEQLLIQQSKMAAMGEMLGNIAHQWRQPLSAISTASTGAKLQKEMDCLTDQQLNSALDAINNSAQYLSKTIDDFRGFFNPNNYKLNEFNILDILTKALKLIDAQFTAKDIEIIKDIENYKLLTIENELIQVLINILNNAKDVLITKEKENRLIFINIYQKDNISYIEIKDNAGGIKEEIINRVFEPYFTTKHQSKGTGIGLYMSHEIVTKHLNGKISVCNENYIYKDVEYMGAKFTVEMS